MLTSSVFANQTIDKRCSSPSRDRPPSFTARFLERNEKDPPTGCGTGLRTRISNYQWVYPGISQRLAEVRSMRLLGTWAEQTSFFKLCPQLVERGLYLITSESDVHHSSNV